MRRLGLVAKRDFARQAAQLAKGRQGNLCTLRAPFCLLQQKLD